MTCEALQVICIAQRPHKLAGKMLLTLPTYSLFVAWPSLFSWSLSGVHLVGRSQAPLLRRASVHVAIPLLRRIARLSVCDRCTVSGYRTLLIVERDAVHTSRWIAVRGRTHQPGASLKAESVVLCPSILLVLSRTLTTFDSRYPAVLAPSSALS